jgi:hypothetical protein
MKHQFLLLTAFAISGLFTAAQADAAVVVTYAESPGQENSTLPNTQVFNFNSLSSGLDTNVNWNGVGTFNQLYIKNADQYGGATDPTHPNGSKYSVQGVGTPVSATTLTLSQNNGYFGMWWSAGDPSNVLELFDGNTLVAKFTTASLLGKLSTTYNGNPRNTSLDSSEPFAFINFYGDANTTWNKIILTNNSSSGFESDNYTDRVNTYTPSTDGPNLPGVTVARVSGTTTTLVQPGTKGAALWGSASAVPGAPAPPFALAAAFGVCAFVKARRGAGGRKSDVQKS